MGYCARSDSIAENQKTLHFKTVNTEQRLKRNFADALVLCHYAFFIFSLACSQGTHASPADEIAATANMNLLSKLIDSFDFDDTLL